MWKWKNAFEVSEFVIASFLGDRPSGLIEEYDILKNVHHYNKLVEDKVLVKGSPLIDFCL
jgi:hypothetical protein